MLPAILFVLQTAHLPAADRAPVHNQRFWRAVIEHEFEPPAGQPVEVLAHELSAMLASPDPEVRDETAYAVLTAWIYQKHRIDGPLLLQLTDEWLSNLENGIGSTGNDGVVLRSFSALMLSVVVARDNAEPFLDAEHERRLFDAAIHYLRSEKDVRGYDPRLGWVHSAAHTADLLKFLARSRYGKPADQEIILDAIALKLAGAGVVFTEGEDERFARTLLSLVNRADFDRPAFDAWIARVLKDASLPAKPTAAALHGRQNVTNLFSKLYVILATSPQQNESIHAVEESLLKNLRTLY